MTEVGASTSDARVDVQDADDWVKGFGFYWKRPNDHKVALVYPIAFRDSDDDEVLGYFLLTALRSFRESDLFKENA